MKSKRYLSLIVLFTILFTACATPPASPTATNVPSGTPTVPPTETTLPTATATPTQEATAIPTPIPATPEEAEGLIYDPEARALQNPQGTPVYVLSEEGSWVPGWMEDLPKVPMADTAEWVYFQREWQGEEVVMVGKEKAMSGGETENVPRYFYDKESENWEKVLPIKEDLAEGEWKRRLSEEELRVLLGGLEDESLREELEKGGSGILFKFKVAEDSEKEQLIAVVVPEGIEIRDFKEGDPDPYPNDPLPVYKANSDEAVEKIFDSVPEWREMVESGEVPGLIVMVVSGDTTRAVSSRRGDGGYMMNIRAEKLTNTAVHLVTFNLEKLRERNDWYTPEVIEEYKSKHPNLKYHHYSTGKIIKDMLIAVMGGQYRMSDRGYDVEGGGNYWCQEYR